MSLLYADTSALVAAYFEDEVGHATLREMLLEGSEPVVTSALTRVELASAVRAAARARRVFRPGALLARIDADQGEEGPLALLPLQPDSVLPSARRLVLRHRLRALDAIHIAVALEQAPVAGEEPLVFVTRDRDQARAARAAGLVVR